MKKWIDRLMARLGYVPQDAVDALERRIDLKNEAIMDLDHKNMLLKQRNQELRGDVVPRAEFDQALEIARREIVGSKTIEERRKWRRQNVPGVA